MKALEKDRARRYATALELGRDVRRYLDGDPVEASPPSLLYRAGKLARKHRGALLLVAGAVSMLVGAALVSSWLMLLTRPDERPAVTSVSGQPAAAQDEAQRQQAARAKRERLLQIYGAEAAGYAIYRDASRKEKVELRPEPVYVWTNPVRGGGQDGAVYLWTCRGRAEALGSFFSYPATGRRHLSHEFHSLSLSVLDVERTGPHSMTWKPQAPGIAIAPIPEAPDPAQSAVQRLSQMRALARDFSASTKDDQGRTWELRLLPQPLYRYQSTDPDVGDGALFGFVTSAGTDLEALLVIKRAGRAGPAGCSGITPPPDSPIKSSGCDTTARSSFAHRLFCMTSRIRIPSIATAPLPTGTYHRSTRSRDDAWQVIAKSRGPRTSASWPVFAARTLVRQYA